MAIARPIGNQKLLGRPSFRGRRGLVITGFYEHIEHTERRVVVGGLLGWVAAKGVGRALDNSIGIPGTAVSPIFHPTSHIIDDIIHSPNLIIGRTIKIPRESFVAQGNLTLCFVVGTHIL